MILSSGNPSEDTTREVLRNILVARKRRNKYYSLRALARDVGVSHSLLSLILNGRRGISTFTYMKIATTLGREVPEVKYFQLDHEKFVSITVLNAAQLKHDG